MLMRRYHLRSRTVWTLSYTILYFLASTVSGCSLLRQREHIIVQTQTVTEYRDSTVYRDSTIYVPIPLETDQAIVHIGDTSHRETTVAESDAWVGTDGFLHHTLSNKSGKLPYQISWPERYLVSSVKNTHEQAHIITREVKVEKPLNAWQRFRIGAFWWLLAFAAALAAWVFRKPLMRLFL